MINQIVVDLFIRLIADYLLLNKAIPEIQKAQKARQIQSIIFEEFDKALKNLPTYHTLVTDINFQTFFEHPIIKREILSFLSPNESPSVKNLLTIWNECYSSQNSGLLKLAFENFISNTEVKLLEIPDFFEIISYKHNRSDLLVIMTGMQDINNKLDRINKGFESSSEISGDRKTKEKYQQIIENCNSLLKNNRPHAALGLLENAEENWGDHNLSNVDKAKILNLIGNVYLVTFQYTEAKEYYRRAIKLDPDSYKYLANGALLELNIRNIEKAKSLALRSHELYANDIALLVLTEVEAWERGYKNLDEIVKSEFLDKSLYLLCLGSIFYKGKNFCKAIDYLNKYLAAQPDDPSANLLLAQAILEKNMPEKWTHGYELPIIGREWKESIDKVINYSKKALDILSSGDNQQQMIEAKSFFAAALAIQGRLDKATEYLDEILRFEPNHKMALHNRIIVSIFKGNFSFALDLLIRLPEEYLLHSNFYAIASRVYIGTNQEQKTIELLESLSGSDYDEPNFYVMLAWANYKLEKADWYENIKSKIFSKSNMSMSNKHETLANILVIAEKNEDAITELKTSLELTSLTNEQKRIKLRLARFYYRLEKFEEAVYWFENSKCDLLADPHMARLYILSKYNLGDFETAYQLCKEISKAGLFDPVLMEIQGRIAEYLTDFDTAISVEEIFIEQGIDLDYHKAQLSRLYFRGREKLKALEILNKVDFKNIENSYLITQCSILYLLLDNPMKAIQLALIAFIKDQASPEVNLSYLNTLLRVDNLIELDVDIVDTNTAVLIDNGNKQEWLKIVDVYEPNIRLNEYSPENEVARKLIGHTIGEKITLKSTEFEILEVEIINVQSIYIRTFQEIAENFSSRFPSEKSFHKVKISRENPNEFLMTVARMGLQFEQVLNIYNSQKFSIEQISYLAGKSLLDIFFLLQNNPPFKIFASKGLSQVNDKEFEHLTNVDTISLTYTGLLTAVNLEFIELLPKMFNKIYISQQVIEEIEKEFDNERFLIEKSGGNIGYYEGRFSFVDIPPEIKKQKIDLLITTQNFIDAECEQIPIEEKFSHLLSEPKSSEEFIQHIGSLNLTSIIIAKQTGSLLYSDESIVREKANEFNVDSFWSQPLLLYMLSVSKISKRQYLRLIGLLIYQNYFTPLLSEDIILSQVSFDNFHCSQEVRNLLLGLSGEDISIEYAISISSGLIEKIWLEVIPQENKFFLQEAILSSLVYGRKNKDVIVYRLINAINNKMGLLQKDKDLITDDLGLFAKFAYNV